MADQANVYVNNHLTGEIQAARYCLPGNNKDLEETIPTKNQEMFLLSEGEAYLIVTPHNGVNAATCPFSLSNEELLSWEIIDNTWKVEIIPNNNIPPEAPLDVNVEVGDPPEG